MPLTTTALQPELDRLLAQHGIPGAVAAIRRDGELQTAAAGTANLNTGAAMTVDTGFLTGSITKVWAATLVMTFVDDGVLDLDAPIVDYAPDVRFGADPEIARSLTVRHLLNHTSGIDAGSYFPPQRRSYPDSVEDYLLDLAEVGSLTAPGRFSSYNNAGWIVAEVVLRRLTGRTFHDLLRERAIEPLGLSHTVLGAEQAILRRTAIGSFPTGAGGEHHATPLFMFPDAFAAAGATLVTTVEDTIRLLRMHLADGVTPEGRRVLTPESARAMRTPTSADPTGPNSGFGVGWMYVERDGRRVLHHGGGSHGGVAWAAISPDDDVAFIAFTNSSTGMPLVTDLAGMALPTGASPLAARTPAETRDDVDRGPFAGTYQCKGLRVDVAPGGDDLLARLTPIVDDLHGATPVWRDVVTEFGVAPTGTNTLVSQGDATTGVEVLTFLDPGPAGFGLLYLGRQLLRRVTDAA